MFAQSAADVSRYMKLGMQGVSSIFSSGDSGVAGPPGDPTANGCLGTGQVFSPQFPATCPYVTAVGATFLPPDGNVFEDEEVAVTRFPSGGGTHALLFSFFFPSITRRKASRISIRYRPTNQLQYRDT